MGKEEEEDRGNEVDEELVSELEDDDDGEEFESSVEDEEETEEDEETEDSDDESEEEDTEDEEEDIQEEEEEEPARIPRGRLNQVIKQRDKERERAAKLEQQNEALIRKLTAIEEEYEDEEEEETIPPYNFKAKEREYMDLFLEGELDKALEIKEEIDAQRSLLLQAEINSYRKEAKTIAKQVQEDEKFQTLVESYETKYPFLDIDSDDFNEEAVDTVNALTQSFISRGEGKLTALRKAVDRVTPMYSKETVEKPTTNKSKPSTAVKRNISASRSQPPTQTGKRVATRDLSSVRAAKLSDKEFASLSEREKEF